MRRRFTWLVALVALTPAAARGNVKPHTLCSDGMVLQQKAKVHVWGTADKGEEIVIEFRGKQAATSADDSGKWLVTIESGEAGGPLPMTIRGKNELKYANVLVGEVWVCSGQSNMEWSVNASGAKDKELATSAPHNAMLRMFTVKKNPSLAPQAEVSGAWTEADPGTVGGFSAVGYFFGRKLQHDLKVPVGMIHTSWGGTRAEAWTRMEVLDASPLYKGERQAATTKALNANTASALYNGMINPVLNYTIHGAIWYQGESNAGQAYNYRTLFPMMIENWRQDWKQGDFPFYFVQLAPFQSVNKTPGESNWAELREAQAMTLKLPNTGMAVITDLGHERDIHPTPKSPVGERLARLALAKDYGVKIEYSGPTLQNVRYEGNKAILTFDHADGLVAKELVPTDERKDKSGATGYAWRIKEGSTNAEATGFTVAGKDRMFYPAKAEITGPNTVTVSSSEVPDVAAVRYGWANQPLVNLFNSAGLPASPFRTDSFPGVTAPKQ